MGGFDVPRLEGALRIVLLFVAHHENVVSEVVLHNPAQQIEGQVGAGVALSTLSRDVLALKGQGAHHVGAVVHRGAADVDFDPATQ